VKLHIPRLPARIGWRDHLIGAALGALYVAALLATARTIGFPRDEGVYFRAGSSYVGWWRLLLEQPEEALRPSAIDGAWALNHEHPPLVKTLFGISWWNLHERWHVFADMSTAFRFPAMCLAGAALWITYVFGARARSRSAGLIAAILLGLMPRVFFHAHLACFDVPIMTMWLLCLYVHWRAKKQGGILWALATGVVFGLALATKHNAWMLPAVAVPHALFVHRRAILGGLKAGRVSLPASLVSMALIGPAVFYALWPYIWSDTLARVQWWVEFHLNHEYYNIEYLGRNYFGPPSPKSYLPVMVLATVPAVTLLLFLIGASARAAAGGRRLYAWASKKLPRALPVPSASWVEEPADRGETDLLVALGLLVAVGPFFLPKTPIFGGTKHWLTAYPFLALLAGSGFDLARSAMHRALPGLSRSRRSAAEVALFASVVAAPLAITVHSTPFGLSSYVPLVGGTAGGADLGLNRQFWGYTSQNAAEEYLNDRAPPSATVFIHDTTWEAWARMQDEGRVRRDLRAVGSPHESQLALVEHELHMNELDYATWVTFGTDAPTYIVKHDGVPIVSIYRR
jgi:4-amino-4-deoxy-L-arabinose transferase-like glycosyltransferase